jgi:hypothetical protein
VCLKGWDSLFTGIKVVDFTNTEYGNLYDIHLYARSKLYSYGLIDDDMIVLDIDVVFVKPFVIKDKDKISGRPYNHYHHYKHSPKKSLNLRDKWRFIDIHQQHINDCGYNMYHMEQHSLCYQGSPLYIPKGYGKFIQSEIIDHIKNVESIYNGLVPDYSFYAIEEEFPLAEIAKRLTGYGFVDTSCYKHGFIYRAQRNITKGFDVPESMLGINVFEKYLQ